MLALSVTIFGPFATTCGEDGGYEDRKFEYDKGKGTSICSIIFTFTKHEFDYGHDLWHSIN
jgi:hypothetical protein